jgi:nitric oxide synthase-interacting protein
MITPEGYLYSRETLLENLLQQKKAIKKKMAAYEAQQQDEQQKVRRLPSVCFNLN